MVFCFCFNALIFFFLLWAEFGSLKLRARLLALTFEWNHKMTFLSQFAHSGKSLWRDLRTEVILPLLRKHQGNLGFCISLGLIYLPVFSEHLWAITVDLGFSLIWFYLCFFLIEEMHAEICYAECLLQKAALTFVQVTNLCFRVHIAGVACQNAIEKTRLLRCQHFSSFDLELQWKILVILINQGALFLFTCT